MFCPTQLLVALSKIKWDLYFPKFFVVDQRESVYVDFQSSVLILHSHYVSGQLLNKFVICLTFKHLKLRISHIKYEPI